MHARQYAYITCRLVSAGTYYQQHSGRRDYREEGGAAAVLADKVIRSFTETPLMQRLLSGSAWTDALVYLFCALALMLCIYLVGVVTTHLQGRLMLSVSQRAIEHLRSDLFCAMDRLPVRFFDTHPTGEIMSRYTNDVDNIDTMLQKLAHLDDLRLYHFNRNLCFHDNDELAAHHYHRLLRTDIYEARLDNRR